MSRRDEVLAAVVVVVASVGFVACALFVIAAPWLARAGAL